MSVYTEFTLWLTPSEPLRASLRATIRKLSRTFDAVEFEPHVTLFCGPSSETEARDVAKEIATQFAPVELIAEGLDHSDRYTKTLFVQFRESALARKIFEKAEARFSRPSNYVLNPHLSLIYKKEPAATRKTLCETLDVPLGAYGFDRIMMIETELPIEDDGPVRRWKVICDEPLLGG